MTGACISQVGTPPNGWVNNNLSIGGLYCNQDFPWKCQADQISSIRVDNASDNCQSPGPSQFSIFTDNNFTGDCVVLSQHGQYPDPNANASSGQTGGGFGLPNDTISSVKAGSATRATLYRDANPNQGPTFGGIATPIPAGFTYAAFGGANNTTSAIITAPSP
jgi:hypothetical protein